MGDFDFNYHKPPSGLDSNWNKEDSEGLKRAVERGQRRRKMLQQKRRKVNKRTFEFTDEEWDMIGAALFLLKTLNQGAEKTEEGSESIADIDRVMQKMGYYDF